MYIKSNSELVEYIARKLPETQIHMHLGGIHINDDFASITIDHGYRLCVGKFAHRRRYTDVETLTGALSVFLRK